MAHDVFTRHASNPILKPDDVAGDSTQVFNAGIAKFQGKYVMVFRADTYNFDLKTETDTFIGRAVSDDGVKWEVLPGVCFAMGKKMDPDSEIKRAYDPRITVIDDRVYMCFAIDTRHGVKGGIAVTDDFEKWEVLSSTVPDNRNMVMFPEKVNGNFCRLERPFSNYGRWNQAQPWDMWFGASPDCRYWGDHELVLGSDHVPYATSKVGPAAPPVKTDRGWLTTIHAVDENPEYELNTWHPHNPWRKRYMAGLVLLDLNEPWKIIGMAPEPIIDPNNDAHPYEREGYRGDVVFPGGFILEDNGELKLYYGAADTCVALAIAQLDDVLDIIEPYTPPHQR